MTSSITRSIQNWSQDGLCYAHQAAHYHDWLENLVEQMHQYIQHSGTTGISPTMAMYLFNLMCMPAATAGFQCNVAQESEALNVANSIRTQITNAQNLYNRIINDIENGTSGPTIGPGGSTITGPKSLGQELLKDLKSFSGMLGNTTGLKEIFGSDNLQDLQGYINNLEGMLQGPPGWNQTVSSLPHCRVTTFVCHRSRVSIWINPYNGRGYPEHISWVTTYHTVVHTTSRITHRWYDAGGVYTHLRSLYKQGTSGGATLPTVFNNITSNFNSLNQSVSGVSSYIQTQVQFLNQNLQQYFSVYNNFFNDFNTLNSYIVSKSTGS